MSDWRESRAFSEPFWKDYQPALERLDQGSFPDAEALCRLLPAGSCSHGGEPIQFVAASTIPGVEYERHIYQTGQVSTREESRHDLFNALVWARFPKLKAAINAVHFRQTDNRPGTGRGPVRDALTLLDESGAIVVSTRAGVLDRVARHDWGEVFAETGASSGKDWMPDQLNVLVCGHALLEKFLSPYKSITAKVLLVQLDESGAELDREGLIRGLDQALARLILDGSALRSPADLSPLPLMGVRGWWPLGAQNEAFYADTGVFRLRKESASAAPVFQVWL